VNRLDSRYNGRVVRGEGEGKVYFLCDGLGYMLGEEGGVDKLCLDTIDA